MNLHKKISLWQKLRIKYEYHWMDTEFHFYRVIADPTWFMTHNATQIERRIASYNAMMEQYRKEKEKSIQEIRELRRKLQEMEESKHPK